MPPSSFNHPPASPGAAAPTRRSGLRGRLLVWTLVATLPLMASAILGLAFYASHQAEAEARAGLADAASGLCEDAARWHESMELLLRYVAAQPSIVSMDPQRQTDTLKLLVRKYTWIQYAHVTLPNGINNARNDGQLPKDYHDRSWFQHAMAGSIARQTLAKSRSTNHPALNIASPIRDADGKILGVVAFGISLESLAATVGTAKFGESGYLLLVDDQGKALGRPDITTGSILQDLATFPPVRKLLAEHAAGSLDFTDEHGARWISYTNPMINGWGAVALQKRDEVFAPVYRPIRAGAVLILLMGLTVSTSIWIVSGTLVKPIRELTDAATNVAAGDWQRRVPIGGSAELEALGRAFNEMVIKLEESYRGVEAVVAERTNELNVRAEELKAEIEQRKRIEAEKDELHQSLVETSREAGKAEVATHVLHNVGNILNSVNVSARVIGAKVEGGQVRNLNAVAELVSQHAADLARFVADDARGKLLPSVLKEIGALLEADQNQILEETKSLAENIDHIRSVIKVQQTYAKVANTDLIPPNGLIKDALRLTASGLDRHLVKVVEALDPTVPDITTDKHSVLQILVNMITNAKDAMNGMSPDERSLTLRTSVEGQDGVRFDVTDNGVGIAPENLAKIFTFGFTTKAEGHGFGMHSSIVAARDLGGELIASSDGLGKGATFTLKLPLKQPAEASVCPLRRQADILPHPKQPTEAAHGAVESAG